MDLVLSRVVGYVAVVVVVGCDLGVTRGYPLAGQSHLFGGRLSQVRDPTDIL